MGPRRCRGLPQAPALGGSLVDGEIGIVEPSIVGLDDIAIAQGFRQHRTETFPLFGEENRYATSEEPVNFLYFSFLTMQNVLSTRSNHCRY